MKSIVTLAGLAVALSVTTVLQAQTGTQPLKTVPPKVVPVKETLKTPVSKVYVTGSRIPRKVSKVKQGPDLEISLNVVDRKQIDQSGLASLAETLKKSPTFR